MSEPSDDTLAQMAKQPDTVWDVLVGFNPELMQGVDSTAKLNFIYGWYLSLVLDNGVTFESFRDQMRKQAADNPDAHYAEVCIRFGDQEVEMTFEEFLQRVGIEIKPEPTQSGGYFYSGCGSRASDSFR